MGPGGLTEGKERVNNIFYPEIPGMFPKNASFVIVGG